MPKKQKQSTYKGDRQLVGLFGAFLGLMAGYIVAEGVLAKYIHPLHWVTALGVAGVAYGLVLVVYDRRANGRG